MESEVLRAVAILRVSYLSRYCAFSPGGLFLFGGDGGGSSPIECLILVEVWA